MEPVTELFKRRVHRNVIRCYQIIRLMCYSFSSCLIVTGKVVLQAAVLTASVVVGLTLYTFWAARRGHDFAILYPFLFACLLVLIVYAIMQVSFVPSSYAVSF